MVLDSYDSCKTLLICTCNLGRPDLKALDDGKMVCRVLSTFKPAAEESLVDPDRPCLDTLTLNSWSWRAGGKIVKREPDKMEGGLGSCSDFFSRTASTRQ